MPKLAPYQIDYKVESKGKTLGATKKKVIFNFGLVNCDALSPGNHGAACRGSEHVVEFLWSLKTGKRTIIVDGKEIFFAETGSNGWTADRVFRHDFKLKSAGCTVHCQVLTETTSSRGSNGNKVKSSEIHPFDLKLNNMSYFDMGRIYELNTPQMKFLPSAGTSNGRGYHNNPQKDYPYTEDSRTKQETNNPYYSGAKAESSARRSSMEKEENEQFTPSTQKETSLISFEDSTPPLRTGSDDTPSTLNTFESIGSSQPYQYGYNQQNTKNNITSTTTAANWQTQQGTSVQPNIQSAVPNQSYQAPIPSWGVPPSQAVTHQTLNPAFGGATYTQPSPQHGYNQYQQQQQQHFAGGPVVTQQAAPQAYSYNPQMAMQHQQSAQQQVVANGNYPQYTGGY